MIYRYCGITFSSNILFPFFFEDTENKPCVDLHYESISEDDILAFNGYCNNQYILSFEKRGYYIITLNSIQCFFCDKTYLYATICNLPFAIVAILSGLIPCHASSVYFDNNAVLLLGDKGIGKTTLACLLDQNDLGNVFCDDVSSIFKSESKLYVNRGCRLMKVHNNTGIYLDENRLLEEVYPGLEKRYYIPKHNSLIMTMSIDRIILIERGVDLSIRCLPQIMHKVVLAKHVVGNSVYERFLLQKICNLINELDINKLYKMTIPDTIEKTIDKINDICSLIRQDYEVYNND